MILLIFIPFIWGFYFTKAVLKEKGWGIVFPLSVSTGIAFFIFSVNMLSKICFIRTAVWITALLMLIVSLLLYFYDKKNKEIIKPESLSKVEVLTIGITLSVIIIITMLRLFYVIDNDYFMHFPTIGLLTKGNIPPVNPYFPYLHLNGHYMRNLMIASFSLLGGLNTVLTLYILTILIQASNFLLVLFISKKHLKTPLESLFAALFVYFGIHVGFSEIVVVDGLSGFFYNNLPLVWMFFFLTVYLFFRSVLENNYWMVLFCAASLGTYAVVYESYYFIFCLTIMVFPLIYCWAQKEKINRGIVFKILLIFIISMIIGYAHGGPLRTFIQAKFAKHKNASCDINKKTEESIGGMTQIIKTSFPKKELGKVDVAIGKPIYVFSKIFMKDQGLVVWFFIPCFLFLFLTRNLYGIFAGTMGILCLLAPMTVDFGRYNAESIRFITLAGAVFAVVFGICIGKIINFLWPKFKNKTGKIIMSCLMGVFLIFSFELALRNHAWIIREALLRPEDTHVNIDEQLIFMARNKAFSRLDLEALRWLNKEVRKNDRLIANTPDVGGESVVNSNSVIMGVSGAASMGCGMYIPEGNWIIGSTITPLGFRGRAFWSTLDADLLRQMGVKWIYLFKNYLNAELYEKIRNNKNYKLLYCSQDKEEIRQIYRVIYVQDKNISNLSCEKELRNLKITKLVLPEKMSPKNFYCGKIEIDGLSNVPFEVLKNIRLFYRIYNASNGNCVNYTDEIKQRLTDLPNGLYFVTPYGAGEYNVEFYLQPREDAFILEESKILTGDYDIIKLPIGKGISRKIIIK